MADKRAIRDFAAGDDPWATVEQWANRQGYRVVEQGEDRRLYRKGSGFFAGGREVELRSTGDQLHLEAWVKGNLPARVMSLFILPAEITIESGGFKATVPRRMGRNEVNDLLEKFGQAPIE